MRKVSIVALISLPLVAQMTPCFGQTTEQINALLRKSKFVDTGRMANTVIGADKTVISTYCNPKASDQDCKVTALLMLKELKQNYESIHRIQVLFYDPRNPKSYRSVEIREGDVLLVDQGKALPVVLSQIDVEHHTSTPPAVSKKSPPIAPTVALTNSGQNATIDAPLTFQNYTSSDGELAITYPKTWTSADSDGNIVLLKLVTQTAQVFGQIILYKHPAAEMTMETLAEQHIAECKAKSKNFKEVHRRNTTCNGSPALFLENTGEWSNGAKVVDRVGYVKGPAHVYMLDMVTSGTNDNEMSRIFEKVFASMRIRS